jgi:hypothetical protein
MRHMASKATVETVAVVKVQTRGDAAQEIHLGLRPQKEDGTVMDLGGLRGSVRLVAGRAAVQARRRGLVLRAVDVADEAAAGALSPEEAWLRVLKAAATK